MSAGSCSDAHAARLLALLNSVNKMWVRDRQPHRPHPAELADERRRRSCSSSASRLLATRSLDELSIEVLAEEAGISRGLLYHYFGNKQEFHAAVVRRAVDDLSRRPPRRPTGEPLEQLLVSLAAYVDYVVANYEGYVSLVRARRRWHDELRAIYEEARAAPRPTGSSARTRREALIPDTPAVAAGRARLVGDDRGGRR